jgi:hypothetical protein
MSIANERWLRVMMLVLLLALWRPSVDYGTLMQIVICAAAGAVVLQTGEDARYFLATVFAGIALIFNPIVPFLLSPTVFRWVCWASLGMFVFVLACLKPSQRVPVTSIADAVKECESVEAVWAWKQ